MRKKISKKDDYSAENNVTASAREFVGDCTNSNKNNISKPKPMSIYYSELQINKVLKKRKK
jgi:hypothetical protein